MLTAIQWNFGVESVTFAIAAFICVGGALGVVMARNPVHSALSLVATLFGVAVLFVIQEAYFLAAIQVIVYAGAIVVLFLFVIMLLGVDRFESFVEERQPLSLAIGVGFGAAISGLFAIPLLVDASDRFTGEPAVTGALEGDELTRLGRSLFTDYVFAFELTSALLIIAVVGAVVLSRRAEGDPIDLDEFPAIEDDDLDDEWLDSDEASVGATNDGLDRQANSNDTNSNDSASNDSASDDPDSVEAAR